MNLMIVESPNKVKKIKTFLGPGWDVAASVGHVRDLPVKSLGVTTPDYQLQYEYTERGKGVVDGLKPRAARADQVYLATDPDREGEAIAWHLKETLQLKRYHRVTFDAITIQGWARLCFLAYSSNAWRNLQVFIDLLCASLNRKSLRNGTGPQGRGPVTQLGK